MQRGADGDTGTKQYAGMMGCKNPHKNPCYELDLIPKTALPLEEQTIPQQPQQLLQRQTSPVSAGA